MEQEVDNRSKADLEWWSDGVIAGGERLNAQRSTLNAQRSTAQYQKLKSFEGLGHAFVGPAS